MQTTEGTALSRQEGKKKTKGSPTKRRHSGGQLQTVRARTFRQGLHRRDLYTWRRYAKSSIILTAFLQLPYALYSLVKANSTKCFPKRMLDKAMTEEEERLRKETFQNIGIRASTSCACSGLARRRCAGSPLRTEKHAHTRQPPVLSESRLGCGAKRSRAEKLKHESQAGTVKYFQTFKYTFI